MRRLGMARQVRVAAGLLAVTASLSAACGGSSASPQSTASRFVSAWNLGDWTGMSQYVDHPAPDFATSGRTMTAGLGASSTTHTLGAVTRTGASASAVIVSRYVLPGITTWSVNTTIDLAEHSGRWLVEWSPAAIDPGLHPGGHLELTRTWAPRAPILGAGGAPLTVDGAAVVVGVEGSRIKDPAAVGALLVAAGATAGQVQAALAAAASHPTFFEPVFIVPMAKYQQLGGPSSALHGIAGTVFEATTSRSAATPGLAAHVVGAVGPITAEELRRLGPAYDSGSIVGQTGLEAAYETQLAGKPGGAITVVGAGGKTRTAVATFSPQPGTAVQTSIDPAVQRAAEAALGNGSQHAALVAVRASTGAVLAAVSVPATDQFDQALEGAFPPGSTFKVITSTALLEKGLTPSSPASCPQTLTLGGRSFHNAEGDVPTSSLGGAFVESCNTAFISLATANLQLASLPAAAAIYGIGTAPRIGLAAFGGRVPVPRDVAGLAETAIGQAQVVVSPLDMAMVAAAVDTSTVRPPRLVAGAPDDAAPARSLPASVVSGLQSMMAQVVTSGTAAGMGLPAGTHAKTGTAEYGSGTPQPTDAWLMGYRGDIAFAIVVQGTGNGGPTDGPLVAAFLNALGSRA